MSDSHYSSSQPLRVVAIGGGTGLSTLLKGLKRYALTPHAHPAEHADKFTPQLDITAIVTVTDDGGSSGWLRREFDVLPPGDVRNCMVALSEDEALFARLFKYRFASGRGLKGHSFGNLFLTVLTHLTGDFPMAVALSSDVLQMAGRIYPSTASNVVLRATLSSGETVVGETKISRSRTPIHRISLEPARCKPLPEALRAIGEADLITLGPGSLYTSIVPNLLVHGIPGAIRRSCAVKACVMNLMCQPGETVNYRASDHVRAIHLHARSRLLDYVVLNTAPVGTRVRQRYAQSRANPVENDIDALARLGVSIITARLLQQTEVVRHDPDQVARIVLRLAEEGRARREAKNGAPPAALQR